MSEKLEKVETRDGSISYKNTQVGETYHSMSGAAQEALEKHVKPSNCAHKKDVVVADVCFGLGYNSMVALAQHQKNFPDGFMQIFAFENDKDILDEISKIDFAEYEVIAKKIKELLKQPLESTNDYQLFLYQDETCSISLYLGDVKMTSKILADESVDVIFFDPFSPKKQPELWSKVVFDEMFRILSKGGMLTTYSCARVTRTNMQDAGFKVADGPVIGRVSPGTLGTKV